MAGKTPTKSGKEYLNRLIKILSIYIFAFGKLTEKKINELFINKTKKK